MRSEVRAAIALIVVVATSFVFAPSAGAEALVGAGVGNADALQAEGNRLYNRRQYDQAAETFLKASRAAPDQLPTYLSLARSRLKAKRIAAACYAYRTYVRHAPAGDERSKAQNELELCERQLRAGKLVAEEAARQFVETKAAFFAALEAKQLVGGGSASESLEQLVVEGYLGPDLADMAKQLAGAALTAAEELHGRALRREQLDEHALLAGKAFYATAADFGQAPAELAARGAFLQGLAEMHAAARLPDRETDVSFASVRRVENGVGAGSGTWQAAIDSFSAAAAAAPTVTEYRYFRALAMWRSGDRPGALAALQRDLPDDPRTAVLAAILAAGDEPEAGAFAVERLLFSNRFPAAR